MKKNTAVYLLLFAIGLAASSVFLTAALLAVFSEAGRKVPGNTSFSTNVTVFTDAGGPFCRRSPAASADPEVSGEIMEDFDPQEAKDLLPGSFFHKEVRLVSQAGIDTCGYILVEIPVVESVLDQTEDGQAAFRDAVIPETGENGFTLIASRKGTAAGEQSSYLYRYDALLSPGENTSALFTTVRVPDFSASLPFSGAVTVTGYLVQPDPADPKAADRSALFWAGLAEPGDTLSPEGLSGGEKVLGSRLLPEELVVFYMNRCRSEAGLDPLSSSDLLRNTALIRAQEASVSWSHIRPDGSAWHTAGSGLSFGENLAKGFLRHDAVCGAWMASPSHAANILSPAYRSVSVGSYTDERGCRYWSAEFGV